MSRLSLNRKTKRLTQIDKCASLKFSQLRIIIRQEYRQKHRNGKGTSHADNQKLTKVLASIHSLYPIPGICHEYKSWQGFHGLWYGWLLYCLGFLCLHKFHHCCISLFRQLDIAIYSLCIFVAVSCDRIIHIGKFCKGTNNLIHILLIIIKVRLQGHIYGLRYKLSPLAELIQWI